MSGIPITWISTLVAMSTSQAIYLSVLFLTGGETSVVPTHVQDPLLHGFPPW